MNKAAYPGSRSICLIIAGTLFLFVVFSFSVIHSLIHIPKLVYYNTTASMPNGFYLSSHDALTAGHLVVIESSRLKYNNRKLPQYLLKRFIPYHGQHVTINGDGLFFDGNLVAKKLTRQGVTLNGLLNSSQAIILGDSAKSYDSRYFGPVAVADLIPVKPFLTW